ncbi:MULTISPECIES: class I SAM-dependent RNA methyltransferase [unclassified Modestobacter]|uniref:class I SAM-dependent RNA methyltransferase n=1 Tax=unclassified Modestobacter TaxID=2643866 RepID=UPI0022AB470E|nr:MULTISPECIES: TRAM domain-containing protein [unclassified Modestobacter]MCZ2827059.1 TRAM domain-containing protein [Modestobacter sp. VKM Ac-2981]MCZ2855246.1 TRAM domain-containing protein [Modestobacter sp. VKM Ac-2982]
MAERRRRPAARPQRQAPDSGGGWVGRRFEVTVGPVAHGGHCVARHEGRVVFVRHTLPGERVVVEVTEDRQKGFCRGDAVEVLEAAPERVERPCPYSGPGKCGGCDWQHVSHAGQLVLKADVVREQLSRLAGLDVDVTVEALPGGPLRWRSRARFAVDRTGSPGLRRHRSHDVVPLDDCPITAEPAAQAVLARRWLDAGAVDVAVDSAGVVTTTTLDRRGRPLDTQVLRPGAEVPEEPAGRAQRTAGGRDWEVEGTGFWQVHPAAADALVDAVLGFAAVQPGETVLDLYAGAGLFGGALAPGVGAAGRVVCVESDAAACAAADVNLADLPQAEIWQGDVDAPGLTELLGDLGRPDVVVLDPPRAGAGKDVSRVLAGSGARAVVYVACDPASLARDVAAFAGAGYRLADLRAFDCFPMTAHVECVALLVRA